MEVLETIITEIIMNRITQWGASGKLNYKQMESINTKASQQIWPTLLIEIATDMLKIIDLLHLMFLIKQEKSQYCIESDFVVVMFMYQWS
jgi:hypothetical protein